MESKTLIIIGAGPAGISAAKAAHLMGISDILIIDRLSYPGGILPQCLHRGFEVAEDKSLNGPECVNFLLRDLDPAIEIRLSSSVISISDDRVITVSGPVHVYQVCAKAIILASGCRERSISSLPVYGSRPAGVFSAGSVQKILNLSGCSVGQSAVVLGSGDVGMITAHHLAKSGTKVMAVIEKKDRVGGLLRNRRLYVESNNIPLLVRRTVIALHGAHRLEAVSVCDVDSLGQTVYSTEILVECDTLVSSVGLIPETELLRNLGPKPWLFVCGNARQVHSLIGSVIKDSTLTAKKAYSYLMRSI
jgi:NADPH-dependent 2,4-dienoyl-CoA reductase/sulfur reductase-like enzyme